VAVYDDGGGTVPGATCGLYFREDYTGTAHITATNVFRNNEWFLLEARCKLGAAGTGALELRVNEVLVGSTTGTFLGPSTELAMSGIQIICRQNGGTNRSNYFDNIAVNDTSGTTQNNWPGRGYTILRRPHRDGTTIQLTSDLPGVSHADRVFMMPRDNPLFGVARGFHTDPSRRCWDPGFVKPTTLPQKDTYTIEPLPFDAGAITGLSLFSEAVSDPPLSPKIRHLVVPTAQAEIQGPQITPSSGAPIYTEATHLSENSNTSAAFTVDEVNGMEIGIRFEA